MAKKIIISLGNSLKSDDNIGNLIIDQLKKEIRNVKYIFLKAEGVPENFLLKVKKEKPDTVFFVDASFFEGNVGDVRVFNLSDTESSKSSTHNIPISFFQKYCKDIRIIGIKVKNIDFGSNISEKLKKKLNSIISDTKKIITSQ